MATVSNHTFKESVDMFIDVMRFGSVDVEPQRRFLTGLAAVYASNSSGKL